MSHRLPIRRRRRHRVGRQVPIRRRHHHHRVGHQVRHRLAMARQVHPHHLLAMARQVHPRHPLAVAHRHRQGAVRQGLRLLACLLRRRNLALSRQSRRSPLQPINFQRARCALSSC